MKTYRSENLASGDVISVSVRASDVAHANPLDFLEAPIPIKGKMVGYYIMELNQRPLRGDAAREATVSVNGALSVLEWVNVYQEKGWEDDLNAVPLLGHLTGRIWALAGVVISPLAPDTGSNLIASGGGQWNENSGADINLSFKDFDVPHSDAIKMLHLKIPGNTTILQYVLQLNQRSCCK